MNLLVGFVHLHLSSDLSMMTFLHPTGDQDGEGHVGDLQSQGTALVLFKSLMHFRRCLPANFVLPVVVHLAQERVIQISV